MMKNEAYLILEKSGDSIIGDIIVQDKYGFYSYDSTLLVISNPYTEGLEEKLNDIVNNNKFGIIKTELGTAEDAEKSFLEYGTFQFDIDKQSYINNCNMENTIILNKITFLEMEEGLSPRKFISLLNENDKDFNLDYLQKESFNYFVENAKHNRKKNKLLVYVDEDKEMYTISGIGSKVSYVTYLDSSILLDIKENPIKDLNSTNKLYILELSENTEYVDNFYECDEEDEVKINEFDFNTLEVRNYIKYIKDEKEQLNKVNKNDI